MNIQTKHSIGLLLVFLLFLLVTGLRAQTSGSPYSDVKGKRVISRFRSLDKPATGAEGIFLNALLWVIENREAAREEEESGTGRPEADYDKMQFSVPMVEHDARSNSCYRYLLSVRVSDNIVTLLASDITYEAETAVIKLVKRFPFEKLQPEKKPKHREYLDGFASLCEERFRLLLKAVEENTPPVIRHWTEIKENRVEKGMTEAECLLSMGKPASVQKQGDKTEWMYDSYTYLFFENGRLSSFIK